MDAWLLHQSLHNHAGISYSRSGGPGGQNVNKVNTKVTLRLKLEFLEGLTEYEMMRLRTVLASRITADDEIVIQSDEERSQRTNQDRAFSRLESLIVAGARLPKHRKATKPSRAAKEARLALKRVQSLKKAGRRFSPEE